MTDASRDASRNRRSAAEQAADDFWEATSLDRLTAADFGDRIAAWPGVADGVDPLVAPDPLVSLRPVRDRLQRTFEARRSGRTFTGPELEHRHLERVLAAVGPTRDTRRTVPEAGALDAVHVYAVLSRVAGPFGGSTIRYDHHLHAVQRIGDAPDPDRVREIFQIEGDTMPQAVVAFVVDVAVLHRKYGPRGSRFALQQVGHAAQNIGLRLAADGLVGYLLGGGLDRDILATFRLAHLDVRYGGAIAFGR